MRVVRPGEVGDLCVVDFGMAAKVRPVLVLTGTPADDELEMGDESSPSGDPHAKVRPMSVVASSTTGYRYVDRVPGVRGGNPIVEGTRVGVHDVIGLLQNGESVESLVAGCFPNLTRAQVYECLAYYEDHRPEIDLLVARQMAPATS